MKIGLPLHLHTYVNHLLPTLGYFSSTKKPVKTRVITSCLAPPPSPHTLNSSWNYHSRLLINTAVYAVKGTSDMPPLVRSITRVSVCFDFYKHANKIHVRPSAYHSNCKLIATVVHCRLPHLDRSDPESIFIILIHTFIKQRMMSRVCTQHDEIIHSLCSTIYLNSDISLLSTWSYLEASFLPVFEAGMKQGLNGQQRCYKKRRVSSWFTFIPTAMWASQNVAASPSYPCVGSSRQSCIWKITHKDWG